MDEIDALGKALDSKLVEKIYDDAVSPGMKELGKVGADLVKTARLLTVPLQIAATFQDRITKLLRQLNERVPEARRIEVSPEISRPAIEAMRYLDETNVLWSLFKEILFKASDEDYVDLVHPAFVHIVKQLTRDEAQLLFLLNKTAFQVVDRIDYDRTSGKLGDRVIESSTIPESDLWNAGAMNIYYSHLDSLSLVEWPITKQDPIMASNIQVGFRRYSTMRLTEFGQLFVKACSPPVESTKAD